MGAEWRERGARGFWMECRVDFFNFGASPYLPCSNLALVPLTPCKACLSPFLCYWSTVHAPSLSMLPVPAIWWTQVFFFLGVKCERFE